MGDLGSLDLYKLKNRHGFKDGDKKAGAVQANAGTDTTTPAKIEAKPVVSTKTQITDGFKPAIGELIAPQSASGSASGTDSFLSSNPTTNPSNNSSRGIDDNNAFNPNDKFSLYANKVSAQVQYSLPQGTASTSESFVSYDSRRENQVNKDTGEIFIAGKALQPGINPNIV